MISNTFYGKSRTLRVVNHPSLIIQERRKCKSILYWSSDYRNPCPEYGVTWESLNPALPYDRGCPAQCDYERSHVQKALLLQGTKPWGRDMLTSSERESTGFCLFLAYLGKTDSDLEYTKWRYLTHTATSHLPQKPPAGWEPWSSWPWLRTSSSYSVFSQYPEKGGGLCLFHHLKSSCTLAFLPSSPPRSTSASHTPKDTGPHRRQRQHVTCVARNLGLLLRKGIQKLLWNSCWFLRGSGSRWDCSISSGPSFRRSHLRANCRHAAAGSHTAGLPFCVWGLDLFQSWVVRLLQKLLLATC